LRRKKFAGETASPRPARKSVGGEAKKCLRKGECCGHGEVAAEVLRAAKSGGTEARVRRATGSNERRRTKNGGEHGGEELCAQGSGECEEDEEEAAVALIKEKGNGLETAGPQRFTSRPAAVRTMGRHVSTRYTRKTGGHTEAHRGSRTASGIRRGALNGRAGVEAN
jgi:hypothetical protein